MIMVEIGDTPARTFKELSPGWINHQINSRRHDGQTVCVRVTVSHPGIDLVLPSCGCVRNGGSGTWIPSRDEQEIIEQWNKAGLNKCDFNAGNLISFLRHLDNRLN
jgi:hypothetical protein